MGKLLNLGKRRLVMKRLRGRAGEKELTFIEFYDSLSEKEFKKLEMDSKAADCLRNGVFYLKQKNIFKATWLIMKSIWYKPTYIFQKLKSNSGLKK